MLKGTRVGSAYVDLVINGDGINEEIVHSVDDAGPGVEKAGEQHGDKYGEKFDNSFFDRIRRFIPGMRRELNKDMEASGTDAGERAGKKITGGIEYYMDEKFAQRIADTFADSFVKKLEGRLTGGGSSPLGALFSRVENDIEKSVSGNGSSRGGGSTSQTKTLGDKIGNVFGSGSRNNAIIPLQLTAKAAGSLINALEKARIKAGAFFSDFGKGADGAEKDTEKVGRGILDIFKAPFQAAFNLFGLFQTGFAESSQSGSGFAGVLGGVKNVMAGFSGEGAGLAKMLSTLAGGLATSGVAFGVVAAAAAVLVSVLSALTAIVTSLAATILSALVGAAAVGAAGFLAMASAAGLAAIAFTSMTDAQRKIFSTSFKPIKEELAGLGQLMLKEIVPAFHQWSVNIQQALLLLGPLAQVMGGVIARAGNIFTAALSGPGFRQFTQALGVWLPSITTNMTKALGGFLNGLLSTFSVVLPYVAQFSRYLADVASRFQKWAASASGQNQIDSFVQRALVSLRSLWNFLKQVGGVLTDVLFSSAGQNTGNNIFDDMANAVKHFRTTITQAKLEKWFSDGKKLADGLGQALKGLIDIFNQLNDSGVISAVSDALKGFSKVADVSGFIVKHTPNLYTFGKAFTSVKNAITGTGDSSSVVSGQVSTLWKNLTSLGSVAQQLPSSMGGAGQSILSFADSVRVAISAAVAAINPLLGMVGLLNTLNGSKAPSIGSLQSSGANALSNTSQSHGGTKPPKGPAQFHNPYLGIANAILNQGPSISAQIKNAILSINKQIAAALNSIDSATTLQSATSGINSLIQNISTSMAQAVNTARDAVQSAAQSLAGASNLAQAKKYLKELRDRQHDLAVALADQRRIQSIINGLKAQRTLNKGLASGITGFVKDIIGGTPEEAQTALNNLQDLINKSQFHLADFAFAREKVAEALQAANQKLTDALTLRDNYQQQVSDSIKSFAALTTAQAQVINGVQQALTSNDIISNLQDKLAQIQKFQQNLNLLLAMGLSNDAYKQIVDAGVEAGSAYAQALVDGGTGAIGQVNSLVQSTNTIADQLGTAASSRLYQAGVDAAQGLVDGLNSLSNQLTSAATALGNSIAAAIKKALGIHSPSKVLFDMMGYVGDGIALGLDAQSGKVALASSRLAGQVAVSPEVASYAASQGTQPTVSGNHNEHHWHIKTPTTDPQAVAMEVLNEVTGRLP